MIRAGKVSVCFLVAMVAACGDYPEEPGPVDPGMSPASGGRAASSTGGSPSGGSPVVVIGASTGGITTDPVLDHLPPDPNVPCRENRSIQSDGRALVVRDEETLSRVPLDRVLRLMIATAGSLDTITPEELLQQLFDTENTAALAVFEDAVHCDDESNEAFFMAHATHCPRAEGELATSQGLFEPGDPDHFFPVALFNRFDLAAGDSSFLGTCGEYRIVYAKESGLDDPDDRVFLILEGVLPNPSKDIMGCRAIAELWAGLDDEPSAEKRAASLEMLFLGEHDGFAPVAHASHFGANPGEACRGGEYSKLAGPCPGRVRVAQGMQEPWEFREFQLRTTAVGLRFFPVPNTDSPRPELFDPGLEGNPGAQLRNTILNQAVALAGPTIASMRLGSKREDNAGDIALDGARQPIYLAQLEESAAGEDYLASIATRLASLNSESCADDPITPEQMIQRVTGLGCAGCHAPQDLLSPGREIGCGQVWPSSLGKTHVDEQGNLSEALTDVFLPARAEVLSTYLQACDKNAIVANFTPASDPDAPEVWGECFAARTPITMANGSERPIEEITPGDLVLSFDGAALVEGRVTRMVVRLNADRLVVVNGALRATPNHPFYTPGGLVRAGALEVGTTLFNVTGAALGIAPQAIDTLVVEDGPVVTYNLEIAEHHRYFAGGFLVDDRT